MNYKDFNLGDWIGHINCAIEAEGELDGNEMRDLVEFLTTLEQETCDDCISRQAVLDCFTATKLKKFDFVLHAREEIKKLPSVKPQQTEWIPVSERLPEKTDYCLCCDGDGYITIGYISKWSKQWCFDDDAVAIDVIAWMPLPKPYEPHESSKEWVNFADDLMPIIDEAESEET